MAVSPADFCLNVSGGRIIAAALPGPATYLPCGTRLVYVPDAAAAPATAIDAEPRSVIMPDVIARTLPGLSPESAQKAWTGLEVVAKLTGTPILTVLRGMPPAELARMDAPYATVTWEAYRIALERYDTDDYWLALGRLALTENS